jgi:exodeoxyribonuclease V alpha subunit
LQLNVINYQETKPATITGIEKYLGSGLIKGVGPVTASRIVAHFGLETLEIIEFNLERLIEVQGIGRKRVKLIKEAWQTQKAIKEVMVFLQGHGVSTTYAVKIYKQYGDGAIATVTENPYQLAEDIYGIGFLSADRIARNVGVSPDSPFKYQAGILHTLSEAGEDGHYFLPLPELVNLAVEKLSQDEYQAEPKPVASMIEKMAQKEELIVELAEGNMPLCYKPAFYYSEQHLAKLLKERLNQPLPVNENDVASWLARYTHSQGIELSPQQYRAVLMAASHRVMVLTGGPGCGKTFCTRTIVAFWQSLGLEVALAAPTGRAAQRLGEMTGLEAKTIHHLLEFDPTTMGFKRDRDKPIPAQAIVIDEASMLDLSLAHSLLKAVPNDSYLLLVGDIDQLPSVGPGNVLRDLINSKQIPVMRLTQVFRQAASSAIIQAAHAINRGQSLRLEVISDYPQSDCLWHNGGSEPEHGVQIVCELILDLLPRLGYNPATDVQVLCPMTRGTVGPHHFNQVLQELINPPRLDKLEINRGGTKFREGDRIIQKKNNYHLEVFIPICVLKCNFQNLSESETAYLA